MNYQKSLIKSVVTYILQNGIKILILFSMLIVLLFMLLPRKQNDKSYINLFESTATPSVEESFDEPSQANLAAIPMSDTEAKESESQLIYIDIKGAVNHPNMYALPLGSRIFDAIEIAGGLTVDAATENINQAKLLEDQMLLYIQTLDEVEQLGVDSELTNNQGIVQDIPSSNSAETQLVNINLAISEELMTLPNIGQKKAEAIIQFRQEQGSFVFKEDIMNVSGIGVKTFEGLEDYITVTP